MLARGMPPGLLSSSTISTTIAIERHRPARSLRWNQVRESRPDVASLLRQAGGQLGIDAAAQAGMLCDLALDGKIEGIKALLINGGPANAADYDRRTALHVAASEGALKICELLIAQVGSSFL